MGLSNFSGEVGADDFYRLPKHQKELVLDSHQGQVFYDNNVKLLGNLVLFLKSGKFARFWRKVYLPSISKLFR